MNFMTTTIIRGAFAATLILALAGCKADGPATTEAAGKPPGRDPESITATPALRKLLRTGAPTWNQVAGSLRVSGRVEADERRLARVSAPLTGRITDLDVVEGQAVKRGDVIATIRSKELSDAQSVFLKADSQRRLAERAAARAKLLLDAGVIGEAEVQRREAEFSQATTDLAALHDQLRVLGMPEESIVRLEATRTINSVSQIVATIDGIVMERKATIGQVVQAADAVCLLADLSRVWLVADVPEQAAGTVEVGMVVEAEIPALPSAIVGGKLTFVSATVNPDTRTVQIRMDLMNPHRKFKPSMLATMLLKDSAERHLVVPATSVVRESNQDYVFVQTGDETFKMRQVTLGGEFERMRVVMAGLNPDETIVLDGAFHLNNERKRLALQKE